MTLKKEIVGVVVFGFLYALFTLLTPNPFKDDFSRVVVLFCDFFALGIASFYLIKYKKYKQSYLVFLTLAIFLTCIGDSISSLPLMMNSSNNLSTLANLFYVIVNGCIGFSFLTYSLLRYHKTTTTKIYLEMILIVVYLFFIFLKVSMNINHISQPSVEYLTTILYAIVDLSLLIIACFYLQSFKTKDRSLLFFVAVTMWGITDLSYTYNFIINRNSSMLFSDVIWSVAILLFAIFIRDEIVEQKMVSRSFTAIKYRLTSLVFVLYLIACIINYSQALAMSVVFILFMVSEKYITMYERASQATADYQLMSYELKAMNDQLTLMNSNLKHIADTDALTSLPNRRKYKEYIQMKVDEQQPFYLVIMTINRFKLINDWYGHEMGDAILLEITKRIKDCFVFDFIARVSGDEFAIVTQKDEEAVSAQLEAFMDLFQDGFELHHTILEVVLSCGCAAYPEHAIGIDDLFKCADIALNQSKQRARSNYVIYDVDNTVQEQRKLDIEMHLHSTLTNHEAYMVVQPIYNIKEGKITSFEALIRWNSKELGMVSPLEFINVAEENGYIMKLGGFMLQEACKYIYDINTRLQENYRISINVSVKQLMNKSILNQIDAVLDQGVKPEWIAFEIVESISMEESSIATEILNQIHNLGIMIYVDDYGTGYSSLNYLMKYPISVLKIDQSLIRQIDQDTNIVEAIISICKGLHLKIVAEGVETKEQFDLLKKLGCDYIQGYYISKPLTCEQSEHFLQEKS